MRADGGGIWISDRRSIDSIVFSAVAADKRLNRLYGNWLGSRGVWYKII